MYYSENLNEPASSLADSLKQHDLDAIACVIVEIIILFFFVWGGGLITSSLHASHGTGYEFLGIYRHWRVLSLKVVK